MHSVLLAHWSDCFVFEIRQLRHFGAFRGISIACFRDSMARPVTQCQAPEHSKHALQVESVSLGLCLSHVDWISAFRLRAWSRGGCRRLGPKERRHAIVMREF